MSGVNSIKRKDNATRKKNVYKMRRGRAEKRWLSSSVLVVIFAIVVCFWQWGDGHFHILQGKKRTFCQTNNIQQLYYYSGSNIIRPLCAFRHLSLSLFPGLGVLVSPFVFVCVSACYSAEYLNWRKNWWIS